MTPDFNRDGKMDLIVGSENTGNNSSPLYVLMSQGDGTFKASFLYNLAYGLVPDVAVADFNHDGFLDLAATTQNEVLVFPGRGDGTLQVPVP
jgi:FG-GAP-like repeat